MNAPVVIFCYNRLRYLRKVIVALRKNPEAPETELFFYSDGGKDEISWAQVWGVRKYLYSITGFKKITVIEQKENKRLEYNVIQGITEVVNQFGRVIVLEDDILPTKYFLKFMNDSLAFYENKKEVMCVSGYNFLKFPQDFPETFAWRYDGGLGWCTWKDRWAKFKHTDDKDTVLASLSENDLKELSFGGVFPCLDCLDLSPIPWDFFWYLCVYRNGVCISPSHSLTKHIGINGTHFQKNFWRKFLLKQIYAPVRFGNRQVQYLTEDLRRNLIAEELFRRYHADFNPDTLLMRIFKKLKHCIRKVF